MISIKKLFYLLFLLMQILRNIYKKKKNAEIVQTMLKYVFMINNVECNSHVLLDCKSCQTNIDHLA